jgi:hypothetical protein
MADIPVPYGYQRSKKGFKQEVLLQFNEGVQGMLDELLKEWNDRYEGYVADGWVELEIINDGWSSYLIGYRPLTDKEKVAAKRRSDKAKEAAARRKAKKEAEERELLERLRAKYDS